MSRLSPSKASRRSVGAQGEIYYQLTFLPCARLRKHPRHRAARHPQNGRPRSESHPAIL